MRKIIITEEEAKSIKLTQQIPARVKELLEQNGETEDILLTEDEAKIAAEPQIKDKLASAGEVLKSLGLPGAVVEEAKSRVMDDINEMRDLSDKDKATSALEEFINSLPDEENNDTPFLTLDDIIANFDSRMGNTPNGQLTDLGLDENQFFDEPLPEWASARAIPGTVEVKSVLPTRDGRHIGNGIVADIIYDVNTGEANFLVCTDAGNVIRLNTKEIQELFHEPKWVSKRYLDRSAEQGLANYYSK